MMASRTPSARAADGDIEALCVNRNIHQLRADAEKRRACWRKAWLFDPHLIAGVQQQPSCDADPLLSPRGNDHLLGGATGGAVDEGILGDRLAQREVPCPVAG